MRVLLDGRVIESNATSVETALEAGRNAARQRGRVVVEASINGRPLLNTELADPSPANFGHGNADNPDIELNLSTADPRQLVQSALEEVSDRLFAAAELHRTVADNIRQGNLAEAWPRVSECLTVWGEARTALLEGAELLGQPVASLLPTLADAAPHAEGRTNTDPLSLLTDALQAAKAAVQTRDWIGLADVLEYDLAPLAEQWRAVAVRPSA